MMADAHPRTPADDLACVEVVELLRDFLEGALPPAEARRVERHLGTCPPCTEYVGQLRTVAGALGGLTEDALPAAIRAGLVDAFRTSRTG